MLEPMSKKRAYPQQELAIRLREAMDESGVTLAELARECGVKIQSVYDWRLTGRIGKQHLTTIARVTKKPLEYFLVGLSRAAAVALVVLSLILQPGQANAHVLHNFLRAHLTNPTDWILRARTLLAKAFLCCFKFA